MKETDWGRLKDESIDYLRNLLKIDTTNPPGNEIHAANYIASVLGSAGVESRILESAPGRANLVARIKGSGEKPPLLLTSHVDVVPASKDEGWSHDPFGGDLDQGFVWGRGAVDMKNMTAMELAVIMAVAREKIPLKRDLIMAAVADEEMGGIMGALWLVVNHPDLVKAEYALNEVGGFTLHLGGKCYYPVQVAEKGVAWMRIKVRGDSGHGSMPNPQSSVIKLSKIVERLGRKSLPHHVTPATRGFIESVVSTQKGALAAGIKSLLNPYLAPLILKGLLRNKPIASSLNAVLHNTVSPTILKAGSKVNVIPSEATVELDGRLLPGQTLESFLSEVRKIVGKEAEIEVVQSAPPTSMDDWKGELWDLMSEALKRNHPGCHPVPFLVPGFTDAKHYSMLGIKCYGFTPMKLDDKITFAKLFHGVDERISVEAMTFGVKTLFEVVTGICS